MHFKIPDVKPYEKGEFPKEGVKKGNRITDKGFSLALILGLIITIIVYNIPHSYFIQ
ncbi:MAG: hypothetical protein HY097_01690 [Nitrospinae bacterium]|nr:hypothetical protein [Nitrospinota bacterium]MBI3815307.1 hypothetical protein [Nitrospinota bacterium]